MKKNVNICDRCNEKISKKKCVLCGKDTCESCLADIMMGFFWSSACYDCDDKIADDMEDKKFWKEFIENNPNIKKKIIEYVKRKVILAGLEGDEKIKRMRINLV